jgi:CHASE2 domain-containing sensor protein
MWHPIWLGLTVKIPINYVGGLEAVSRVPLERLMGDETDPRIQNKIVIFGLTSPLQGDVTPLSVSSGHLTSGPVILANALNTLLTRQFIRVLHPWVVYGLMLAYGAGLWWMARRVGTWRRQLALGLGSIAALILGVEILFVTIRFQMVVMPFTSRSRDLMGGGNPAGPMVGSSKGVTR